MRGSSWFDGCGVWVGIHNFIISSARIILLATSSHTFCHATHAPAAAFVSFAKTADEVVLSANHQLG